MSIETIKRKRGMSFRAVTRIGRRKVSKTFERKIDAKQWEAEMRTRAKQGESWRHLPQRSKTTLDELWARFKSEHSAVRNSPSTSIMNESLYRNYIGKTFGPSRLVEISPQVVEEYLLHLVTSGQVTRGRANRIRQLLHVMLNRAISWRLLGTNPVSQVAKLPGEHLTSPKQRQFLSKENATKLLTWLKVNDPWLYPKIVVILHTGIRYGEMVALQVSDARLLDANPHLQVRGSRCRHTGKFVPTKGKRCRIIPLAAGLIEFLKPYVHERRGDEPLLWESWEESRWPTKADRHYRKAVREAEVNKVTIHDLRHTYAVRFLEHDGNMYDLKELLGHRKIDLTMHYSHFSPAMADRARGVVDFESPQPHLTVLDGGAK